MATQEGMENGFELLNSQMEPFEYDLDENPSPLVVQHLVMDELGDLHNGLESMKHIVQLNVIQTRK